MSAPHDTGTAPAPAQTRLRSPEEVWLVDVALNAFRGLNVPAWIRGEKGALLAVLRRHVENHPTFTPPAMGRLLLASAGAGLVLPTGPLVLPNRSELDVVELLQWLTTHVMGATVLQFVSPKPIYRSPGDDHWVYLGTNLRAEAVQTGVELVPGQLVRPDELADLWVSNGGEDVLAATGEDAVQRHHKSDEGPASPQLKEAWRRCRLLAASSGS